MIGFAVNIDGDQLTVSAAITDILPILNALGAHLPWGQQVSELEARIAELEKPPTQRLGERLARPQGTWHR